MQDVISLNNVWKKYKIGTPKNLTDIIPSLITRKKQKEFWALKGVNLKIKIGETIGLIGPNGSGKSTLLKILSGVTNPTEGEVSITGKVVSLLELGTGFHQELTGRENIFLYGAILGLTRQEIKNKFSEIISFAGIDQFIDTPIKHYSSGMYVRLAFSVVIHLKWDIMLIDEILSVGDANFQEKSFKKIKEISKMKNKTIILVSHNLNSIKELCKRVYLIENGVIKKSGKAGETIDYYLKANA